MSQPHPGLQALAWELLAKRKQKLLTSKQDNTAQPHTVPAVPTAALTELPTTGTKITGRFISLGGEARR